MRRFIMLALLKAILSIYAIAQPSLPTTFRSKTVHSPEGADIYVHHGGIGSAVLLVHGYAENSDSWAPLAEDVALLRRFLDGPEDSGARN